MQRFKKWKVLITPKEACDSLDDLRDDFSSYFEMTTTGGCVRKKEDLISLIKDKDAVVLDLEGITSDILEKSPGLKVISRFGEGCDAVDLEAAVRLGVKVTRTSGVSSIAVARHTVSLMLALAHHVAENDRNIKNREWNRQPNISETGTVLGIIGFGKIGRSVAELASALGFRIIVHSLDRQHGKYKLAGDLKELIASSDMITIHVPLEPATKNIISRDVIKMLKGKYLINTARGGLVDEKTILDSLERGDMLGYATDVFTNEPPSGISQKLASHPKVISSPHISAFDKVTSLAVTRRALDNILNCLNNQHDKVASYVA